MKKSLKVIGIIFAILFVIGALSAIFEDSEDNATESKSQSSSQEKNEVVKSKWKYSESTNEMDNSKTLYATLQSENKIDFEFPYDGGSTFNFIVRKTNGKYDLLLSVSNGQFMTNLLNEEHLRIKFDENDAFKWNYHDASDASMDVIFPVYSDEFLKFLKRSKTMLIEAPFAFAGRKVIRFKTENLKADF